MKKTALLPPRDVATGKLFMITIPGLSVKSEWRVVHDRLLDEFPRVTDVLPTTLAATLLIVYAGSAELDSWLHAVSDAVSQLAGKESPRWTSG